MPKARASKSKPKTKASSVVLDSVQLGFLRGRIRTLQLQAKQLAVECDFLLALAVPEAELNLESLRRKGAASTKGLNDARKAIAECTRGLKGGA